MTTTTTIPTNAAELEELLADPARIPTPGSPEFTELIQNYTRAVVKRDQGALEEQIKDQSRIVLAEMLDKDKREVPSKLDLTPDASKGAARNKRAPGNAVESLFDGSADFLQTIWHNAAGLADGVERAGRQAEARRISNSYGSLQPGDGGFLVPETLRSELLRVSLETSLVRPRARVIPMESARVPIPSVDSTSNASSIFGGVTAYWTEEAGALSESQATFGRVVLDSKKLTAYAEVPNELIADAPAFGAFFDQTFPQAVSWFEDVAFVNGSGAGEPLGFLNADAAISVTKETGQAASTIVWENIGKIYSRMLPTSLGNAVWIANIDTFPQLSTMALSVGTGGSAIWINNGAEGPPMTILGRPVIFSEKVKSLTNAGDLNFVDLSYYLIGDRQTMLASSSPHYKFANDKTAYRVIQRVDGRPWLGTAITPNQGTNTLSPFVKLGAR